MIDPRVFDGPNAKRPKDYGQFLKGMALIHKKELFKEVKMPRKKRSDRGVSRGTYRQLEAAFREKAKEYLLSKGCKIKKLENSIKGKKNNSFPDEWIVFRKTKWAGWVEYKSLEGKLSSGEFSQEEFKEDCDFCNVNHIVARELKDFDVILGITS